MCGEPNARRAREASGARRDESVSPQPCVIEQSCAVCVHVYVCVQCVCTRVACVCACVACVCSVCARVSQCMHVS